MTSISRFESRTCPVSEIPVARLGIEPLTPCSAASTFDHYRCLCDNRNGQETCVTAKIVAQHKLLPLTIHANVCGINCCQNILSPATICAGLHGTNFRLQFSYARLVWTYYGMARASVCPSVHKACKHDTV